MIIIIKGKKINVIRYVNLGIELYGQKEYFIDIDLVIVNR